MQRRQRAAGNTRSDWGDTRTSQNRNADRIGTFRVSTGGKMKRTVKAVGVRIHSDALEQANEWFVEGMAIKPTAATVIGSGADMYYAERRAMNAVTDPALREVNPELLAPVPPSMKLAAAPHLKVADPRDRLAREQVREHNWNVKRSKAAAKASDPIRQLSRELRRLTKLVE